MKYRLVIFDFDGTLADSGAWFLGMINDLADEFGFRRIEPSDHEVVRNFSAAEVVKHLGVPAWKLPALMLHVRQRAARDWQSIKLFPGIEQMLQALRSAGLKVAIVSSNAEGTIRSILGPSAGLIDYYLCGASLFGKAAKLRSTLRKSKVSAESAIYIGDEIRDAVAARDAGMAFGAVAWGYTTLAALEGQSPTICFLNVAEIAENLLAP